MPDETDYIQSRVMADTEAVIADRVRYEGESARECEDCGEPIPRARREAIPGVSACVECQGRREWLR